MAKEHFSVIFKKKINRFNKSVRVDSDKSISQRSFIIGSISEGVSKVKNALESEDIFSREKFEEFEQLMSWSDDRFFKLKREGWIERLKLLGLVEVVV